MNPDQKDTLTLVISSIAVLVSGLAALFSFLTYRRNRKLENENHIFKLKIEAYSIILSELNTLINAFQKHLNKAKTFISKRNTNDLDEDNIDDSANEVDDLCFKFDDTIVSNSLILPENILRSLEKISKKIMNEETVDSLSENRNEAFKRLDLMINEIISDANKLNDSMRKDIKIVELNLSLYKRIAK